MRIGIDARMYGQKQTGIGIYIENLIKNILKLDDKNEYVLFCNDCKREIKKEFKDNKNIKVVDVSIPWYSFGEQIIFPFKIWQEKLDLMHFPHFNAPIFCPVKFVVTIHDMTPKYFPGNKVGKSFFRQLMFDLVMGRALKDSEKIIAVSNFTKDEILKFFPKIKKEKVEVIYEGIREEFFSSPNTPQWHASSETLASLSSGSARSSSENLFSDASQLYQKTPSKFSCGCSSETCHCGVCLPSIFYTGVWRDHKNLVGLIKAFKVLKDKYKMPHKLVLGGSEDLNYPEVRKTWEELDLGKDIILTGFLDLKDQIFLYGNCDLYVSPSFCEGFGFTPLEAMSQGAAVALSDIPAHREIAGNLPIFFNPRDEIDIAEKIHLALSNKDFRKKIRELGPEYVKKYQWQNCARETLTKVYHAGNFRL